jgi:hypothetical protein
MGAQKGKLDFRRAFETDRATKERLVVMANTLTFTSPCFILYRPNLYQTLCAGVASPGSVGALIELQVLDPTGENSAQLWLYGSDQRIYQYPAGGGSPSLCIGLDGQAGSGNQLQLVTPQTSPEDHTQQWQIVTGVAGATAAPIIYNGPSYSGGTIYCMNDAGGKGLPGDAVIIFPCNPFNLTANVEWSLAIYPNIPGQIAA